MGAHPNIDTERGWTLIELVIAMVLMIIAFGLVTTGIINAMNGAAGARGGQVSDAAVARTAAAFADDVAKAESPGRANGQVRDAFDLAQAVQHGTQATSTDPYNPGPANIEDVVTANGNTLELAVDVVDNGADQVECVRWAARPNSGKLVVSRTVLPAGCGGGALSKVEMLSAPVDTTDLDANPFSYVLKCNRGLCTNPPSDGRPACDPWTVNDVTGAKLRWVIGVRATFMGVATEGRAVSSASGTSEIAIRSRDTREYRTALGC